MTNEPRPFQKEDKVYYTVKSQDGSREIKVVCEVLDYYFNTKETPHKKYGWNLLLLKSVEMGEQLTIEKHWDQLNVYYEPITN